MLCLWVSMWVRLATRLYKLLVRLEFNVMVRCCCLFDVPAVRQWVNPIMSFFVNVYVLIRLWSDEFLPWVIPLAIFVVVLVLSVNHVLGQYFRVVIPAEPS
jgi:hypothetical protein